MISSEGYSTNLCNLRCESQLLTHHMVNLRYLMFRFHLNPAQKVHFASVSARSVNVYFQDTMFLFSTCSTRSRHISKRPYTRHAVQCMLLYLSFVGYGTSLSTGFSMSTLAANSRTEPVENTWRWRPQSYIQSFGPTHT